MNKKIQNSKLNLVAPPSALINKLEQETIILNINYKYFVVFFFSAGYSQSAG